MDLNFDEIDEQVAEFIAEKQPASDEEETPVVPEDEVAELEPEEDDDVDFEDDDLEEDEDESEESTPTE